MGSEVILPGTPTSQIPPGDRPIFDSSLQNGYAGLAGGGSASAANLPAGVTKETYYLNFDGTTTGQNIQPVPETMFAAPAIASAGSVGIAATLGSAFGVHGQLVLQALGSVTSGAVLIGRAGGSGVINLSKIGTLILPDHLLQTNNANALGDTELFNTDAASQTVGIAFSPKFESLVRQSALALIYDFATGSVQFNVGPSDILRIRELMLTLRPYGLPNNMMVGFDGTAQLRVMAGGANTTTGNYPIIMARSLAGRAGWQFSFPGGDPSASTPYGTIVYNLEQPVIISGADIGAAGSLAAATNAQSWAPRLWVTYSPLVSLAGNVAPSLRGIFEVFRNAA
jgi:hypothetical protein